MEHVDRPGEMEWRRFELTTENVAEREGLESLIHMHEKREA